MQENIEEKIVIFSKFIFFCVLFIGLKFHAQEYKKNIDNQCSKLDSLLNLWHRNAADAKINDYFSFMSEDFVFLGTDPKERWNKKEFNLFCKPYFEKKTTWNFTPLERYWNFSLDNKIYWFDERIETWMGDCRGSGVVKINNGHWEIAQYNLTVLIENEKIQEFIKLRKNE